MQFVSFVTNLYLSPERLNASVAFLACLQLRKVIHLHMCCNNLANRQARSRETQRALFYVKTDQTAG
ncbi:hypothetical protein DWS23_18215 [Escherichia coli]|nr:hypothetical protein C1192_14150 [Escherichia marmotae]EEV6995586.1 hypothetical protein [Escherichia coli]PSS38816.1 hypothetical protein BEM40_020125 [Escherichia sp. MOD1-EC5451]PSY63668.1 hypothetical protein C7B16_18215 [Escherichia sp. 20412-1]EFA4952878.1 hypothetical protein [Escherichia coli]